MERDQGSTVSPEGASQQLDQLRSDQRWSKLTGDAPKGYDAIVGGCLVVHLLLIGLMVGLSSGEISHSRNLNGGDLLVLALVNLYIPVYGQIAFQRRVTGSWRGTVETRLSTLELIAAAASYLLGLVLVVMSAARGLWVPMAFGALLGGVAWVIVFRRVVVRYRAEVGYPGSLRLYATFPLFVVSVFATDLVLLYALSLLGRLVPGL